MSRDALCTNVNYKIPIMRLLQTTLSDSSDICNIVWNYTKDWWIQCEREKHFIEERYYLRLLAFKHCYDVYQICWPNEMPEFVEKRMAKWKERMDINYPDADEETTRMLKRLSNLRRPKFSNFMTELPIVDGTDEFLISDRPSSPLLVSLNHDIGQNASTQDWEEILDGKSPDVGIMVYDDCHRTEFLEHQHKIRAHQNVAMSSGIRHVYPSEDRVQTFSNTSEKSIEVWSFVSSDHGFISVISVQAE